MDKPRLVNKVPMFKTPGDFSHRFQGEHGFASMVILNFWPSKQRKHITIFLSHPVSGLGLPFQDASMSETEYLLLNCVALMSWEMTASPFWIILILSLKREKKRK